MIVCSCNVFSDHQVRSVVAKEARRPLARSMPASDAVPSAAAALTPSSGSWMTPFMRTQACPKRNARGGTVELLKGFAASRRHGVWRRGAQRCGAESWRGRPHP